MPSQESCTTAMGFICSSPLPDTAGGRFKYFFDGKEKLLSFYRLELASRAVSRIQAGMSRVPCSTRHTSTSSGPST